MNLIIGFSFHILAFLILSAREVKFLPLKNKSA